MDIREVLSRDGKLTGGASGSTRRCTMEGCRGLRWRVKWPDGTTTWPCSKGMLPIAPGLFRIM